MDLQRTIERIETVVIGGGQSGLSVGYHLARRGRPFVILDAGARIGDQWRARWDSLRLFTPARFDGLAGMPFPADPDSFPTKDAMADYLESYAAYFSLPVRSGVRVTRVSRRGGRFLIATSDALAASERLIEADQVVVAMASYQAPRIPGYARDLDPAITHLHSHDYRAPSQLQPGPVLIVGAGNSGSEIAMEVSRSHQTWMSGRDTGHLPFDIHSTLTKRIVLPLVLRVLFHRILTLGTPIGRKARPKIVSRGGPLIRVRPGALAAAGVARVPRMTGVRDGKPVLEDGRVLEIANIIWCTGFHPGFDWIDLPIFGGEHGEPVHDRGVVPGLPGLYFVGLHFLYAMSSTMIHGASRDAEHIAAAIETRVLHRQVDAVPQPRPVQVT